MRFFAFGLSFAVYWFSTWMELSQHPHIDEKKMFSWKKTVPMKKSTRFYVVGSPTVRMCTKIPEILAWMTTAFRCFTIYWFGFAFFVRKKKCSKHCRIRSKLFLLLCLCCDDMAFASMNWKKKTQCTTDRRYFFPNPLAPFFAHILCAFCKLWLQPSLWALLLYRFTFSTVLICPFGFRSTHILWSNVCNSGANSIMPDNIYRSHRWSEWF